MKTGRAFVAGVVGGLVMTVLMAMGRAMGMHANLEMMEGTMMLPPGPAAWWVGLVMHLIISGIIGVIYGLAFEYVSHRATWWIGALFSLVHSAIAGGVMAMMPMINPRMPSPVPAPGYLMANMGGMYVIMALILHAIYGAVVGAMYGPVVHARPATADVGSVRA